MLNRLTIGKLESSVRHNWMADLLVFVGDSYTDAVG